MGEMSGSKRAVAWGIVVVAGGIAIYLQVFDSKQESAPDTAESRTAWACRQCELVMELTAKELDEALLEAAVWTDEQGDKDAVVTSARTTSLLCPDCKATSVARADVCLACGTPFAPYEGKFRHTCRDCAAKKSPRSAQATPPKRGG